MKQDLEGRLKRSWSWIEAAMAFPKEQCHARFLCFYIAFNALYGQRQYEGDRKDAFNDSEEFLTRIRKLSDYDHRNGSNVLIVALNKCRKPGGELITNHFLRNSYWKRAKNSQELINQFLRLRRQAEDDLDR